MSKKSITNEHIFLFMFVFPSLTRSLTSLLIATLNIFDDIFMNTQISFSFAFYITAVNLLESSKCDIELVIVDKIHNNRSFLAEIEMRNVVTTKCAYPSKAITSYTMSRDCILVKPLCCRFKCCLE